MQNNRYPKLFEEGRIGKMSVKNRVVMPPMATNFAGPTGEVTERLIRYYVERAKGGAGLIIVENAQVKYPQGKNVACQLRLDEDKYIPGYQELAEAVQTYQARVFLQIHHAGRQYHDIEGAEAVAPSEIPDGFLQQPVRALRSDEIEELVERFATTADRAKQAGMDGVEFHGAHGYLIGEFMSPYTNQRIDSWGGSFERRMRFPLKIIERTRALVGGSFPLCFRFSADEFVTGGLSLEDSKQIARALQDAGIDVLHVSCGIYESVETLLEPMRFEEGWRTYLADEIKKTVDVPVITVGQIRRPETAERILEEGKADFVAVGRTLIADPAWPRKAQEGRPEEIRKCISCNIGCIGGHVFGDLYMRCTVNPVVGHERFEGWSKLIPAEKKKKVVVAGGGPGGMEAALVAARRGHDVVLYEKESALGGQVRISIKGPGKDKLRFITEYYESHFQKQGLQVNLNSELNEDALAKENPDVLIVATGAEPLVQDIRGIDGPNVLKAWDVLEGKAQVPGNVVVVAGGGLVGCEAALHLARQGKRVTIIEMASKLAADMEPITRFDMLKNIMPEAKVGYITDRVIMEISDKGVTVLDHEGKKSFLDADNVVNALGSQPVDALARLAGKVPEMYLIGDCKQPRQIINATFEGSAVARLV